MKLSSLRALLLALICMISLPVFAGININTASAQELADTLKGIGPSKAEAIVAYRQAHGPFQALEQLTEVKGIGTGTLNKNRELIDIESQASKQKQTKQ